MNHPFELELSDLETIDLDFEEQLTNEETARIGGGKHSDIVCISAPCPGSEGGDDPGKPWPTRPRPSKKHGPKSPRPGKHKPPEFTTLAIGEEGGDYNEF
ncbi:MAG TPA: hypothetical protein V6C71_00065 [Coleofasciculaceae cyanobacterium]|jgi:hypothetical protein